ncbi:MAG: ribosome biogenesis GTPase Der [Candidatus Methylomirabilis sp.]|nr:ribosome biogenesis GTPase Der [Deltaproteobacteria bacterium]
MKPVVAIVGRPNVGKSTLFNQLVGERRSLVLDQPGVTRDRLYADVDWDGYRFVLIDTGGYDLGAEDPLILETIEQTKLAIDEADLVVLLLDAAEGLTPLDAELASILRKAEKRALYAVNKVDDPKHEARLYEFYRLGTDKLFPLSAEHKRGFDELMEAVEEALPAGRAPEGEDAEATDETRIAIIGRPNAGKSTLLNALCGKERSVADPRPGTTRDAVDTVLVREGRRYRIIDTAGIRRKSRTKLSVDKIATLLALRALERAHVALLVIDGQEGVTDQDAHILGYAVDRGRAVCIVVNKWDIVEKDAGTTGVFVNKIREELNFAAYAPIQFISAKTGQRVQKLFEMVDAARAAHLRRVGTGELNRFVPEVVGRNPPPLIKGRRGKILYITQTGVAPPTFVAFTNTKEPWHFSYERYLVNALRERYDFEGTPIRMQFRAGRRGDAPPKDR